MDNENKKQNEFEEINDEKIKNDVPRNYLNESISDNFHIINKQTTTIQNTS